MQCLNYVKINGQGEKNTFNSISSAFIQGAGTTDIDVTDSNIKKAVEAGDKRLGESLLNIIIDTKEPKEHTIKQCI